VKDKRYQLVWWGWGYCWTIKPIRDVGGHALIYRWRVIIGPLEIRRWRMRF